MAASANWRCADCDTYNEPAETSCTICGGARRTAAPRASSTTPKSTAKRTDAKPAKPASSGAGPAAPKSASSRADGSRPAPKRPGTARPSADWRCTKCDTNNARTDLSCIACGTGWKTATKKTTPKAPSSGESGAKKATAPRKATPRKPTPKRTRPTASTPRDRTPPRPSGAGTSPGGTRPRDRSTGPSASPGAGTDGVFFPPPGTTGYRPSTAPSASPTMPSPGPTYTPGPTYSPHPWPPPRPIPAKPAKKSNWLGGCIGAIVIWGVLGMLAKGCENAFDSDGSPDDGSTPAGTAPACPGRIAAELPEGDGAELVEAFRTSNKQITLCRTTDGSLYYFGEFSDQREQGIAMNAEETSDGYEAYNDPYRYVIHDGVVTIYNADTQIGEEKLTPEPSPS
ncbi:zinc finger protein [Streptomyces flaveus]|uniref:zinc finger protein n=1 Tax=Streptomyces flaveus TaxID=66370 RepID=UPI00331882D9